MNRLRLTQTFRAGRWRVPSLLVVATGLSVCSCKETNGPSNERRSAGVRGETTEASGPSQTAEPVHSGARSVVEFSLEARPGDWELSPGHRLQALTYNGTVPGPTIRASVGDNLVIHFKNSLTEPTTIHWHGLRISPEMDGAPASQRPVAPGETFEYRFTVRDAGTFWYHPHVNESHQMEHGLYGAIVVAGPNEPKVDADHVLQLDDVRLDKAGQIAAGSARDIRPGRHGNRLVINGKTDLEIAARAGEVQRWRLINVANARYFRVGLESGQLQVIASDGGFAEAPRIVEDLLLAPGDRYEVLVTGMGAPGTTTRLLSLPVQRSRGGHGPGGRRTGMGGHHARRRHGMASAEETSTRLLTVRYSEASPLRQRDVVVPFRSLPPLNTDGITPTIVRLGDRGCCGRARFTINGGSHPNVPALHARVGETQVWHIINDTHGPHPFHLHGYFFQVLGGNAEQPVRAWEDNVHVPVGGQVQIAFRPEGRPGRWLYHCHILEHGEHGMAAELLVTEEIGGPSANAQAQEKPHE